MIPIASLIKKMILITIILTTTDIIRLPIEFLSVYRIFLIVTFIFAIAYIIKSGKLKKGRYLLFVFLLLSSPLAYLVSTNREWAFSFMLNDFMGLILIFLIANFFNEDDKNLLMKNFIRSHYFTIGFSAFSLYMFYFNGGIPQKINILNVFSITLSEDFLERGTISNQIRLSLPYATPPHLSIIMAVAICILVFNKKIFSKRKRICLIIVFSIILLLTNSRTGIVAGIIAITMGLVLNFNFKINIRRVMLVLLGSLVIIPALLLFEFDYIDMFLNRFVIENITQDRHLLVPLEGILIWLSNPRNFLIGIGYGSSIYMQGKFTILPPHFLNSFVTLLAEKGLIGLIMVLELLRLLTDRIKVIMNKKAVGSDKAISYSYIIILSSFLFYEAKQIISVWVIIGVVYMLDRSRNNVREE